MELSKAGFGIHIVEACAPQRNDPHAQIIKLVYDLRVYRVVDEHAHTVKALCQLDGVLAESRLKILDLNVRSGRLWFSVIGNAQPPIWLGVHCPFIRNRRR